MSDRNQVGRKAESDQGDRECTQHSQSLAEDRRVECSSIEPHRPALHGPAMRRFVLELIEDDDGSFGMRFLVPDHLRGIRNRARSLREQFPCDREFAYGRGARFNLTPLYNWLGLSSGNASAPALVPLLSHVRLAQPRAALHARMLSPGPTRWRTNRRQNPGGFSGSSDTDHTCRLGRSPHECPRPARSRAGNSFRELGASVSPHVVVSSLVERQNRSEIYLPLDAPYR